MTGAAPLPSGIFPDSYDQARARFRTAARDLGLALTSHALPGHTGPDGAPLTTDCALAGDPRAPHVLFIQSGIHGVEGYCGSACQTGLMLGRRLEALPACVRVVLIHALNPFGFALDRRVNEDNVDLNRNFLDHDAPLPDNPDYDALRAALVLEDLDPGTVRAANRTLRTYADRHGAAALQRAITAGQYTDPQGLYYGGRAPAWSHRLYEALVTEHAAHARTAVLLDIHTGLGAYGAHEVILELPPDAPQARLARRWWGPRATSTLGGDSVSPPLEGCIDMALPRILPGVRTLTATLEFGTSPTREVFAALRADNWAHRQSGLPAPQAAAIRAETRRVFYPDADDWKVMVLDGFTAVCDRAIEGLGALD